MAYSHTDSDMSRLRLHGHFQARTLFCCGSIKLWLSKDFTINFQPGRNHNKIKTHNLLLHPLSTVSCHLCERKLINPGNMLNSWIEHYYILCDKRIFKYYGFLILIMYSLPSCLGFVNFLCKWFPKLNMINLGYDYVVWSFVSLNITLPSVILLGRCKGISTVKDLRMFFVREQQ